MEEINGVSNVLWLDDIIDLKEPLEIADNEIVKEYYNNNNANIPITIRKGDEVAVTKKIYEIIGKNNAMSGQAVDMANSQQLSSAETKNAALILVPIILIILVLSTGSWIEPLLFLFSIGVSIIINMGSNIFLGEVSYMTKSVSPILQMAVSLDYAIFLLHSFADFRAKSDNVNIAMARAMKKSFPAIAASAATTLFGFVALTFMDFSIGKDLGLNLVKGIVFSFISVMFFYRHRHYYLQWIDKTRHKTIIPKFKNAGTYLSKLKIPSIVLVGVLIIP